MDVMTREQILQAIKTLPSPEQLALAREILVAVEGEEGISEAECEAAWIEEVNHRRRNAREMKAPGIQAEEIFARARASVRH
jgi:hypothetical protein